MAEYVDPNEARVMGTALMHAPSPNGDEEVTAYPSNDELFAPTQIVTQTVPLSPWREGGILLAPMDGERKVRYQQAIVETIKDRQGGLSTRVRRDIDHEVIAIIFSAVHPSGELRFSLKDIDRFKAWPGFIIHRIGRIALKLGGQIDEDEQEVVEKEAFG